MAFTEVSEIDDIPKACIVANGESQQTTFLRQRGDDSYPKEGKVFGFEKEPWCFEKKEIPENVLSIFIVDVLEFFVGGTILLLEFPNTTKAKVSNDQEITCGDDDKAGEESHGVDVG